MLAALVPSSGITGKYGGEKILSARAGGANAGFAAANPLITGLDHVFEGNTISTPTGKGLVPLCWASDGKPLLASYQMGVTSPVVFGGYTSFYPQFCGQGWDGAFSCESGGVFGKCSNEWTGERRSSRSGVARRLRS